MKAPEHACPPPVGRRDFCKKLCAAGIGGAVTLVPLAAGLAVFFDPLRRQSSARGAILVTTLDALPADGLPRKFPVLANRVDAWNKFSEVPIGAVYLRRPSADKVQAFNVVCPHAGCFVDFLADRLIYQCPCHKATYTLEGQIADRNSPAPRGLDSLEVEVRDGKEVWVKFENFEAGHAEKIPVA
jgi:menaquinol-cytochrome c reductase iron-sulfur subunit